MSDRFPVLRLVNRSIAVGVLLALSALLVSAQSSDINAPSPVQKSDLLGRIAARDLGDSRFTNHYYAFTGTPGDLLITVQSRNLNGDIDVFTAGTLRPLLKLSLYAESNTPVTKSIFLRRRENLVLRIEARSPNDDEGTYQILFSGSFEAIAGGPEISEAETPTSDTATASNAKKGRRVTSVGARIDEPTPPVTEIAAAPTPEPTPEATPVESPPPASTKKAPVKAETARSRRPTGRRSAPPPKPPVVTEEAKPEDAKKTEDTKSSEEATKPAVTETEVAAAPKPKPKKTNTPRSGTTARPLKTPPATPAPAEPAPEPEPEIGPRLIIEVNDGTMVNRSMSKVRRVTVERGWVVVTGNDGKVDRYLLVNVTKMTIQP